MDDIEEIKARGRVRYGDAWLQTGRWLSERSEELKRIGATSYAFVMLHQKAVRQLNILGESDEMVDLIGYLNLIVGELGAAPKTIPHIAQWDGSTWKAVQAAVDELTAPEAGKDRWGQPTPDVSWARVGELTQAIKHALDACRFCQIGNCTAEGHAQLRTLINYRSTYVQAQAPYKAKET